MEEHIAYNIEDSYVELTEKYEIKAVKNFYEILNKNTLDYSEILEELNAIYVNVRHEFLTAGPYKILCIDVEPEEAKNMIHFVLRDIRKKYTGINSNFGVYQYMNTHGNIKKFEIGIEIKDQSILYATKDNYKCAFMFKYDIGTNVMHGHYVKNEIELKVHQNLIEKILHIHSIAYITSYGDGSPFSHYPSRSKYKNRFWVDPSENIYVTKIYELPDRFEVLMRSDDLEYAYYGIDKQDILDLCNTERKTDLFSSKLFDQNFINMLNNSLNYLKLHTTISSEAQVFVFYTTINTEWSNKGHAFIEIINNASDYVASLFITAFLSWDEEKYHATLLTDADLKKHISNFLRQAENEKDTDHYEAVNFYREDLETIINAL